MDEHLHTTVCHVDGASTRDGVPLNVSVTVSWQAHDAQAAGLPLASDRHAIEGLTQTPLRRWVALSTLIELLSDRAAVEHALHEEIGAWAGQRGMSIRAVAVGEVCLPPAIQAKADALTLLALRRCLVLHRAARGSGRGLALPVGLR